MLYSCIHIIDIHFFFYSKFSFAKNKRSKIKKKKYLIKKRKKETGVVVPPPFFLALKNGKKSVPNT